MEVATYLGSRKRVARFRVLYETGDGDVSLPGRRGSLLSALLPA